jgi:signal transduction histidine kinase
MNLSNFSPICGTEVPNFLIFDFSVAPPLLFYAYIPIILTTIFLSIFILKTDKYSTRSKLFFGISVSLALWIINIIMQWVTSYHTILLFAWQLTALFEVSLFLFSLYFFLVYLRNGYDISIGVKWLISIPFIITALLTPTTLNISQYDIENCEGVIGQLWFLIYYVFEPFVIVLITLLGINYITRRVTGSLPSQKEAILMTSGLVVFLLTFLLSNVAGELTKTYEINLLGPIGLLIFLVLLAYQFVKYKIFNTGIIATEALVTALVIMIGSMLFFSRSTINIVLISISLVLVTIGGSFLIRSVRSEIQQREQITKLASDLQTANLRLKDLDKMKTEFVSIASHQLRSPLTSIRGYTSMLLEGSYGKLPVKAAEVISKISDSSKYMALSIEDYLNVSRIEAGNMRYEMSDFNAKELVEKIVDEMRPIAIKKGLVMVFRSDCNGSCAIHADIGKTRQIVMNLLDNSMKYTPKGTITVVVHDDVKKKILSISVQDTGVGMSAETIDTLFEKFVRAKNANCVNVTGTGLGLYVAKKMTTEMGAKIWTESEGEGKGSTFHVEFALLPGKPKALK